jgi:hypothetical protein
MGRGSASGAGRKPNNPPGTIPPPTGGTKASAPNPAPQGHGHGHLPHTEFKFLEELKHRNDGTIEPALRGRSPYAEEAQ